MHSPTRTRPSGTSAPDGAHDDCVSSAALVASFFSAASHAGRYHVVQRTEGKRVEVRNTEVDDDPEEVVEPDTDSRVMTISGSEAVPTDEDMVRRPLATPRCGLIQFRFGR